MIKNFKKERSASTKRAGTSKPGGPVERAPTEGEPSPTEPASKIHQVIALLSRPNGATLSELVAATGWQPHTTRAALTGLKKKGHGLSSEKTDGVRLYRVAKPS